MLMLSFQLQVITHIFATRAQPDRAELSVPALRGLLRYWFRFGMGNVVGNDLAALHKLEAAAFGSTESASPFQLRVNPPTGGFYVQPVGTHVRMEAGHSYLGFSLYERQPIHLGGGFLSSRACILPDQTFTLTLRLRRPDALLEQVLLGSLWLLTHLGGVGCRSRRGFGVVAVEGETELAGLPFHPITNVDDHYRTGIGAITSIFTAFANRHGVAYSGLVQGLDAQYNSLADARARIIRVYRQSKPDQWFSYWGSFLRGFRSGYNWSKKYGGYWPHELPRRIFVTGPARPRTADYWNVVTHYMDTAPAIPLSGTPLLDLQNDVLGLPCVFRCSTPPRQGMQASIKWQIPKQEANERRASPLYLRPLRLHDGSFATVVAFFAAQFLPDGANVTLQRPNRAAQSIQVPCVADIHQRADELFGYLDDSFLPSRKNPVVEGEILAAY